MRRGGIHRKFSKGFSLHACNEVALLYNLTPLPSNDSDVDDQRTRGLCLNINGIIGSYYGDRASHLLYPCFNFHRVGSTRPSVQNIGPKMSKRLGSCTQLERMLIFLMSRLPLSVRSAIFAPGSILASRGSKALSCSILRENKTNRKEILPFVAF